MHLFGRETAVVAHGWEGSNPMDHRSLLVDSNGVTVNHLITQMGTQINPMTLEVVNSGSIFPQVAGGMIYGTLLTLLHM